MIFELLRRRGTPAIITFTTGMTSFSAATLLASRLGGLSCPFVAAQGYMISVPLQLGRAAAFLGDPAAARGHFERALEGTAKIGCRPEGALARLGLAETLLAEVSSRAGQPAGESGQQPGWVAARADALRHLDLAIAEFRAMKMQPALERALRHKGSLGA